METNNIFERIITWNKSKGIPQTFEFIAEANMLTEEHIEFLDAVRDNEAMVDALADYIVVATGTMWKLGYDAAAVMEEVLLEIESRGGSFNKESGKWEKRVTGNEHKAQLDKCKWRVPND